MKQFWTWSIGERFIISKFALLLIVDLINWRAPLTSMEGILVYYFASSLTRIFIFEKGLSSTIPPMQGSLSAWRSDVTAPIDLPHKPIVLTLLSFLRYSTIRFKSSLSHQPNEMYSPSDRPHPAKSKQKRVMFEGSMNGAASRASILEELFPWR